jgi:ABC-2 type transport system permease protein
MIAVELGPPRVARAFAAVLGRDLFVTGKELPAFLAQVVLQPFFLIFVFGKILTSLGYARPGYSQLLLPGIIALTIVLTGIQSIALPLVIEFGWTKEIEDRLLAPLPTDLVAVEKVVFSSVRALLAGAVMFPIGWLVLGSVPFEARLTGQLIGFLVLAALAGSALGLVLGTSVEPTRISLVFALALTPLIFTGCAQYPWPSLSHLPWFQYLTLLNPLTYASEGVRASMTPHVPHITPWVSALALTAITAAVLAIGIGGFRRRAID